MEKLARGLLGLLALLVGFVSAEATGSRQYVFLVDTSASMIGREDGRTLIFPQVQRALMRFAEQVVDPAEIRIVPFSQEPLGVARFVLPREREEMLRYIRSLRPEGNASFIYRSVNKIYDELCSEPRAFYLFTDGLDNSGEPARMPEQKGPCPLTLVVLGTLPQDFSDSWKGARQTNLAEQPAGPPLQNTPTPPDPQADRQENAAETPAAPVAPADPTPKAGLDQAIQKEYGEEPSPPPAPAPEPIQPEARPTSPQPQAMPPSPQPSQTTPTFPQPRPRPPTTTPPKPQTSPSAAPRQPAEPSAPPATPPPLAKPNPTPAPPPVAKPQPARYLLKALGPPSLVDGAVVVVYRLEGNAQANLPLLLSLKRVPANLQVSYNNHPTAISLRPGEQFELRVSNQGAQKAVVETAFQVVSAPGALVELPPVLQLRVPPLEVRRNGWGWIWAWVVALGGLLLGLGLIWVWLRRNARVAFRAEPVNAGLSMSYGPSEGGEVRVLSPSRSSLISLDFFGAAPEQRRKYIPALEREYDLGEATGDANLERLRVHPGLGGLEVVHIPGHLSLSLEAKDPIAPGQTVGTGRMIYISDISTGTSIGILSVQKL